MAYIELNHVKKELSGKAIRNDITLCIERGETVGFVGANGSGKTMLFRAIAGLMHTDGRPGRGRLWERRSHFRPAWGS